jgi:hypothetical protein
MANHSRQDLPVLARTASSLMAGVVFGLAIVSSSLGSADETIGNRALPHLAGTLVQGVLRSMRLSSPVKTRPGPTS